jgi:two-component system alkaline phosphatase synthesis response regulator PhoP
VPRILIVEDEPAISFGLELDLKTEGYDAEIVDDGDLAVRRGREVSFDLIVLDVMLPGKDGFDVLRALRRSGVRTPVLMLTAKNQEAEKVMGLDLGADDYLTKPFSPKELRARIRALLRRSGDEGEEKPHRFGDVEVDFMRGEVRRNGATVEMTPLEFKLLAAFVRHRGRVLSRARLLDLVWGSDTFVTERVVDNYIVTLRKKLEPEPGAPRFLVNVRGQGYRFDG